MRPYLERLPNTPDASWSRLNRRLDDAIPFQWHHHPEFELTLTLNSRGQRFVGDHVGHYGDRDLVLVGPNLPHTWASSGKISESQPHIALVLWFQQDWMTGLVGSSVELQPIRTLMARAQPGLAFSATAVDLVQADIEGIFARPPAERLLSLLSILNRLASDDGALALAGSTPRPAIATDGRVRIDRVLVHIHQHYTENLRLGQLAEIAALSVSGLHRLFGRHTRCSISEYLIRLRIGDACARLSGTDQPIQHIAAAVGYASLANFNRQFRSLRRMTPRAYRKSFRLPPTASAA